MLLNFQSETKEIRTFHLLWHFMNYLNANCKHNIKWRIFISVKDRLHAVSGKSNLSCISHERNKKRHLIVCGHSGIKLGLISKEQDPNLPESLSETPLQGAGAVSNKGTVCICKTSQPYWQRKLFAKTLCFVLRIWRNETYFCSCFHIDYWLLRQIWTWCRLRCSTDPRLSCICHLCLFLIQWLWNFLSTHLIIPHPAFTLD